MKSIKQVSIYRRIILQEKYLKVIGFSLKIILLIMSIVYRIYRFKQFTGFGT